MKAMRSRCLGSMLAWILNTKPENFGSSGCHRRASRPARGSGGGDSSTTASSKRLHAEVVHRRAEEHRRLLAAGRPRRSKVCEAPRTSSMSMRSSSAWSPISSSRRGLSRPWMISAVPFSALRVEDGDGVVVEVIDAAKALAHADRPGHRRALDAEHRLDFVEQVDRLLALAVELVDEGQDRRVAQAADVQQLDGLRFDAVDRVDHHHRRVHRRQRAVGVFGEILVARRVEQVDHALAVGELHHRRGHRDAALLFQFHPVRGRVARRPCAPALRRPSGWRRRTTAVFRSAWSYRRRGGK